MVLLCACATPAAGPGAIRGRVVDVCTGAPVDGAAVFATAGRPELRTTRTGDGGFYLLGPLPPGEYAVGVERDGALVATQAEVMLRPGRTVVLTFQTEPPRGVRSGCVPLPEPRRPPPP